MRLIVLNGSQLCQYITAFCPCFRGYISDAVHFQSEQYSMISKTVMLKVMLLGDVNTQW